MTVCWHQHFQMFFSFHPITSRNVLIQVRSISQVEIENGKYTYTHIVQKLDD